MQADATNHEDEAEVHEDDAGGPLHLFSFPHSGSDVSDEDVNNGNPANIQSDEDDMDVTSVDDNAKCVACGMAECHEGDDMIICDVCDNCYHLSCLNPPMGEPPDGKWFCSPCVVVDEAARRKAIDFKALLRALQAGMSSY
jgi:hypothetical protein